MSIPSPAPLRRMHAADFWKQVVERGGLKASLRARGKRNYDSDLETVVATRLGLSSGQINAAVLKSSNVTIEQLVDALFSALEPWAALMSQTFEMFAAAGAQHGGDGIQIRVQLDEFGPLLRSSLASFERETVLTQRTLASTRGIQWGTLDVPTLRSSFQSAVSRQGPTPRHSLGSPVAAWSKRYREWGRQTPGGLKAPPEIAKTGDLVFDTVASQAQMMMRSLLRATHEIAPTRDSRRQFLSSSQGTRHVSLGDGWQAKMVAMLDNDYLAVTLYETLDWIGQSRQFNTTAVQQALSDWTQAVRSLSKGPSAYEQAEEFLSLLDLPSWKERHQLYAVWVASRIVDAAPWPARWAVSDGTLNFDFGGAEIARFAAEESQFVLRSELARPLIGKSAGKRSKGIRPDFTVLCGDDTVLSPAHLVVECKQYRTSSKANFRPALSDYARSHPNADVLLSNYGPVLGSVWENLADRSRAVRGYGEARPFGSGLPDFDAALATSFERAETLVSLEKAAATARRAAENDEAVRAALEATELSAAVPRPVSDRPVLGRVSLRWRDGGDLDLHVHFSGAASEYHVSFRDHGRDDSFPFAVLDHDSQSGPGAETVTLHAPLEGRMKVTVRLYSGNWPSEGPEVILEKPGSEAMHFVWNGGEPGVDWEVVTIDPDWLLPESPLFQSPD